MESNTYHDYYNCKGEVVPKLHSNTGDEADDAASAITDLHSVQYEIYSTPRLYPSPSQVIAEVQPAKEDEGDDEEVAAAAASSGQPVAEEELALPTSEARNDEGKQNHHHELTSLEPNALIGSTYKGSYHPTDSKLCPDQKDKKKHEARASLEDDEEATPIDVPAYSRIMAASVQPLPSASTRQQSAVGAHPVVGVAASAAPPADPAERASADVEAMVQAELVNSDVVHAQEIKETPRKRLLGFGLGAVVIIVALVLVLALVLTSSSNDSKSQQNGIENAVVNETSPCFGTSQELFEAVSLYYEDPTPNSTVAQDYGWPIGSWCVSRIWDFSYIFKPNRVQHRDNLELESNLTDAGMVIALNFHQNISGWDMESSATHLEEMMRGVHNLSANWGLDDWQLPKLTSLMSTFADTIWTEPRLNLSGWNTSNVHSLFALFQNSNVSQAGISNWDVSRVDNMWRFAEGAVNFNEHIGAWDMSSLTQLRGAFRGAVSFNQDLSQWNTSSITSTGLINTFRDATVFNGDLSTWDVQRVESLKATFRSSAFNQPIASWNVSSLKEMTAAFRDTPFNVDLSSWDVSSVTDLGSAFQGASSFSQNLCAWGLKLPKHAKTEDMFKSTNCPNTTDPAIPGGPFCFPCVQVK